MIPPRFPVALDFSEGLAAVRLDPQDKRTAYIDRNGRVVIQPMGDGRADRFRGGLAAIDLDCPGGYLAQGAKWGYIDRTGKVVCTFIRSRGAKW